MKPVSSIAMSLLAGLLLMGCPTPAKCDPGADTCACKPDSSCNDGLVCNPTSNTCGQGTLGGIQVGDAKARGCELLLTESAGTTVAAVAFKNGVVGTWVREAPRVAITFVAPKDEALPASSIDLNLTGPAAGLALTRSSCVDGTGAALASSSVTLQ